MNSSDVYEKLRALSLEGYTGNITFSFHKGSLSSKVKIEYLEDAKYKNNNKLKNNKEIKYDRSKESK